MEVSDNFWVKHQNFFQKQRWMKICGKKSIITSWYIHILRTMKSFAHKTVNIELMKIYLCTHASCRYLVITPYQLIIHHTSHELCTHLNHHCVFSVLALVTFANIHWGYPGNGLVMNRQHTITWTNNEPFLWSHMVPLGHNRWVIGFCAHFSHWSSFPFARA